MSQITCTTEPVKALKCRAWSLAKCRVFVGSQFEIGLLAYGVMLGPQRPPSFRNRQVLSISRLVAPEAVMQQFMASLTQDKVMRLTLVTDDIMLVVRKPYPIEVGFSCEADGMTVTESLRLLCRREVTQSLGIVKVGRTISKSTSLTADRILTGFAAGSVQRLTTEAVATGT